MKILKKSDAEKVIIPKKNNLEDWCKRNDRLDLLDEWDYKRNEIIPSEISYGSHQSIFWICKNNHSFLAEIHNRVSRNSGCPYCVNKKFLEGFNDFATWCQENNREELLAEWDYEKNVIKPTEISYGSRKTVFWICEKYHSYDEQLKQRTSNNLGCPYCSNHRVLKGFNDFKSWCEKNNREDLLIEWDYEKNDMEPDEIVYSYSYKIWWKCRNNHSFSAELRGRSTRNTGCLYCANLKVLSGYNDFETWCKKNNRQDFLEEWDYEKNSIKPSEVMRGNNGNLWWRCKKGHSYLASLNSRVGNNCGCPYCSNHRVLKGFNDFETWCKKNNREDLLDEWDYTKNKVEPTEIIMGNKGKVWWKCKNHQSYTSSIYNHIKSCGCPICLNRRVLPGYNDFATWCGQNNRKDLLDEWDFIENTTKPTDITYGSQANIIWKCKECGYKWKSSLRSRTGINNSGCPHCNQSKGEKKIANYLSTNGINYIPQYRFNDCRNIIPLPFDFAVFIDKKILIIEYDGEQHYRPIPFSGNMDDAIQQFKETKKRDKIKTKYCADNNIPLLRISYTKYDDSEMLLEEFIKKYG